VRSGIVGALIVDAGVDGDCRGVVGGMGNLAMLGEGKYCVSTEGRGRAWRSSIWNGSVSDDDVGAECRREWLLVRRAVVAGSSAMPGCPTSPTSLWTSLPPRDGELRGDEEP
jgi:hypothetical protein